LKSAGWGVSGGLFGQIIDFSGKSQSKVKKMAFFANFVHFSLPKAPKKEGFFHEKTRKNSGL